MAFGSGSSLASDCWIRRGGRPSPLQACNEGRAKRLHQASSSKPTTHSGLTSERRISRSRRLFSFVLGVGAGDPALGAQPALSHALQRDTHGLRAHPLFGYPLLEARFGGQSECPQARVPAELPGASMKHLAQLIGPLPVEGGTDLLGSRRALAQSLLEPSLVEALYGGARRLGVAAQRAGYPVGILAPGAGEQDLATAEDESVGGAQAVLQSLALGIRNRTHEDRSSHADHRSILRMTYSEDALVPWLMPARPPSLGGELLYGAACFVLLFPSEACQARQLHYLFQGAQVAGDPAFLLPSQ